MSIYSFGPFRLDPERLLLSLAGEPVAVGPKVVETLLALVERPGETLTKSELLDRIWPEGFIEESSLAQNIYVIRKVLRAHWTDAIQTVPRRGYRFAGDGVRNAPVEAKRRTTPRFYYGTAAAVLALAFSFGLLHDTARSQAQQLSAPGARLFAVGTYYWKQRTQSSVRKSIGYFSAVVKTDPKNARGYAALAQAYAIAGDTASGPSRQDSRTRAPARLRDGPWRWMRTSPRRTRRSESPRIFPAHARPRASSSAKPSRSIRVTRRLTNGTARRYWKRGIRGRR